jgi:hypothetical protein
MVISRTQLRSVRAMKNKQLKRNLINSMCKQVAVLMLLVLVGCASKGLSPEEMEKQLKGFSLPEKPSADKALVYFIYNKEGIMLPDKVELFYAKSTPEKFENKRSQMRALLNVFTFGATEDAPEKSITSLGNLKPGQYKTLQLEPGFYEVSFKSLSLSNPASHINQVKLEEGKTHYMQVTEGSFYNRYAQILQFVHHISSIEDELKGRYILSNNFQAG